MNFFIDGRKLSILRHTYLNRNFFLYFDVKYPFPKFVTNFSKHPVWCSTRPKGENEMDIICQRTGKSLVRIKHLY